MNKRFFGSILSLALICVGCSANVEEESGSSAIFRGDNQNTGVYVTKGVPKLTGEKWQLKLENDIHSSPVLMDGTLYFGDEAGQFYAVNAKNGKILWNAEFEGKIRSTAAVYEDELYFTDSTSTLYALERTTGTVKWSLAMDNPISTGEFTDEWDYYIGSPAVEQDVIYVGGEGPSFYAVNRKDGKIGWTYKTGAFVHGKAALAEGNVFIADMSGQVVALDQLTGERKWSTKNRQVQSSLAYKDGVLYYGSRDTNVYAIDAKTGEQLWNYMSPGGSWVVSSASVNDKYVAIGSSDSFRIHVFERQSGEHSFDFYADSRVFSSPAIVDNVLYFGTAHTNWKNRDAFYAVDLETQKELWRFEGTKAPILSSPIVADGVVYYASMDGYLYALE
ncbi:outer membrane protein assembly factor BamB family protein [Paenibacillus wynnii]|uniref:outer membrane protein assembly factor BamB family protein n=1 Tax=Paenibacillus wynnii TaxID=268407 RepID=UPI00279344CB|nr:PQQ-binding-like beta-propeller repeat protein [Paenibacillus wynnii]MDQ0194261.1 outer membrane protein assembly factor BamB [Paenibacillus wynnii]